MAIRDTGSRGQTVAKIDPRTIKVYPNLNARDMNSAETRAHVEELAESIRAQGFLGSHPLEVFKEGDATYVAAGHCRLAAIMLLINKGENFATVPCLAETRHTSPAQRLYNQIISNSGHKLNLAEEGRVYFRLVQMGYVISVIAKDVGRSEAHVRHALEFNAAPTEAHALVSEGKVSPTLAAATIRKEGATKGVATLKRAVKRAESEGRTKATPRHVEPKAKPVPVPVSAAVACVELVERLAALQILDDPDAFAAQLVKLRDEARAIFTPARDAAA